MLLGGCLLAAPKTAPRTTGSCAERLLEQQCKQTPTWRPQEKGTALLHCQEPSVMVLRVGLLWGSPMVPIQSVPLWPSCRQQDQGAHELSIPRSSWTEVTGREQVKLLQT